MKVSPVMDNPARCRYCNGSISVTDVYCRYCGKAAGSNVLFRHTHGGIILFSILFGPLALPFILKSPVLSKNVRTMYVALNLAFTALSITMAINTYNLINRQVHDTMKVLEQTGIGLPGR